VLWRALRNVDRGRYIEVGANDPVKFSMSMAFYSVGWSGITVEPDPAFAQMHREQRPRDLVIEAAITAKDRDTAVFHVVDGTGLSTLEDTFAEVHSRSDYDVHDLTVTTRRMDSVLREAGWEDKDVHFMSVDTEGSERDVLESTDLSTWRPWVLVVEATEPLTTASTRHLWEHIITGAGYRFCLFDGLSCFYVSEEHSEELGAALSYPACPLDDYMSATVRDCIERVNAAHALAEGRTNESRALLAELIRWRGQAITRWAAAMEQAAANRESELAGLRAEIDARRHETQLYSEHAEAQERRAEALQGRVADLEASTSWRVTKPLRTAGGIVSRVRRHP
jgi:FkbM family methyltransferase